MENLIDRIIKKLERAERTIQVLGCLAELESFSEHERMVQIRAALSAYYETAKQPICAKCGMKVGLLDEAINAEGQIVHRDC